jgi:hypothetical protein
MGAWHLPSGGEVFVFGSYPETNTAEVYKIRGNTWTDIAPMPVALNNVTSTYNMGSIFSSSYNHPQIVVYALEARSYS